MPPAGMLAQRQFFLPGTKEGDRIAAQQPTKNFADRFRAVGYTCITRRKRADGVALQDDVKTDANGRVVDENLLQFIDLVTKCLDLDPEARMKPRDALQHPFFSQLSPRPGMGGSSVPSGTASPKTSASRMQVDEGDGKDEVTEVVSDDA